MHYDELSSQIRCPRCKRIDTPVLQITQGKIHYGRANCRNCGRWIDWVRKPGKRVLRK